MTPNDKRVILVAKKRRISMHKAGLELLWQVPIAAPVIAEANTTWPTDQKWARSSLAQPKSKEKVSNNWGQ
ncbi:MAG: hypothetical protein CMI17_10565 [Opitutaceae bacterium]|nr:hypothetical protein [Opitutaceae bacterium]